MTVTSPSPSRPRPMTAIVVLDLVLGLAWLPVLLDLVRLWTHNTYYAHAPLVPLFAAWLVWDHLKAGHLRRAPALAPGLGMVALALAMLGAGTVIDSLSLRALSIPVAVSGIVVTLAGRTALTVLAFPLGFLVLMLPLPDGTIPRLSLPLQQLAATVTALTLPRLGIPAIQDGLLVHLSTGVSLAITEACNGLRFLFTMIVIGVAFAGLTVRGATRRVLTVAVAVVVAVAANLVRVTGTGVVAYLWGPEAASGMLHIAYGKVVYAVMLVPFVATVLLLRRARSRGTSVARA